MKDFATAVALTILFCPARAFAQPANVDELILLARAVPPEIAADTLIKIAGAPGVGTNARAALLDEAWALADNAQEPHKRQLVPGGDAASRGGWLSRAALLDLDRLSLKSRVLIALVRDDPKRALQMFETLAPMIPPLTCADDLAYDLDGYYRAAAEIAQHAFAPAARARGDRFAFLENVIYGMRSPIQVPPIAQMLIELDSHEDLARLSGVFALMLRVVRGDDRAFSYTMRWKPSRDVIENLAVQCRLLRIQADAIVDAYRSYLVRHLTERRCASLDGGPLPGVEMVERFNTTLRRAGYASASEIVPITPAEMKPISVETARATSPSNVRTTANQISAAVDRALNSRQMTVINTRGNRITMRGRFTMPPANINLKSGASVRPLAPDFLLQVHALKDRLAIWRPTAKDDPEEYFQLKSELYAALFTVDPLGPFGEEVIADYVMLLAQQDIDRYSRAGWFLRVHELLEAASSYGPDTGTAVRERMVFSGHTALKAIVALTSAKSRPTN